MKSISLEHIIPVTGRSFLLVTVLLLVQTLQAQPKQLPDKEYTLQKCLLYGLENNYSVRIARNDEQIVHNNVTLGNAGFLPTLNLSAGTNGNVDNTETKIRETGNTNKVTGNFDQTYNAGLTLN